MSTLDKSAGVPPVRDVRPLPRDREWTFICLVDANVECVRCRRPCGPVDSPGWVHRGSPAGVTCDECANASGARVVWGDVDRFGLDG